jgi:hypothetical protein
MTRLEELIADQMRAELRELKMTPAQREKRLQEQSEYGKQVIREVAERVRQRLAAGQYVPPDSIDWLRTKGFQFDVPSTQE